MVSVELFGPLDAALGDVMAWVVLALAVINIGTRLVAHRQHVKQAEEDGAEAISRHPVHQASLVLLVLASFYYTTLHQHGGVVVSTLVAGVFLSDFFEFEARKVEARRDVPLDRPKGSIAAGMLVLAYAGYQALFFLIEGPVGAII